MQPCSLHIGKRASARARAHKLHTLHSFRSPGIVARIGPPPYLVALRADIDGLPIEEAVESPFKSTHPGHMVRGLAVFAWSHKRRSRRQRPAAASCA